MKVLYAVAVLFAIPQYAAAQDDLREAVEIKQFRVSIRLPKDWKGTRVRQPTIFRMMSSVESKTRASLSLIHAPVEVRLGGIASDHEIGLANQDGPRVGLSSCQGGQQ